MQKKGQKHQLQYAFYILWLSLVHTYLISSICGQGHIRKTLGIPEEVGQESPNVWVGSLLN